MEPRQLQPGEGAATARVKPSTISAPVHGPHCPPRSASRPAAATAGPGLAPATLPAWAGAGGSGTGTPNSCNCPEPLGGSLGLFPPKTSPRTVSGLTSGCPQLSLPTKQSKWQKQGCKLQQGRERSRGCSCRAYFPKILLMLQGCLRGRSFPQNTRVLWPGFCIPGPCDIRWDYPQTVCKRVEKKMGNRVWNRGVKMKK